MIFKEAGLTEQYGSGIKRILKSFSEYGLVMPLFENFQHGFKVTIYNIGAEKIIKEVGEKVGEKLTENQEAIIDLISKDPDISAVKLSGVPICI
ncbi:MAG: ATP-binding protein [Candidatus Margulisiibacteriota bacterium]